MKNKIFNFVIFLIILYLFVSAIYVLRHIDFGTPPSIQGPGFSESNNIMRIFMGLPKTFTTYEGVPGDYLIQVIVKIILGVILLRFIHKKGKKKK